MQRTFFKFSFDILLWTIAVPLAFWLRLDTGIVYYLPGLTRMTLASLPVTLAVIVFFKLHRQSWHQVSIRDLLVVSLAATVWTASLLLIGYYLSHFVEVPRSIPYIAGILGVVAFSVVRASYRLWFEYRLMQGHRPTAKKVLIVGAGEAGKLLLREMQRHPEAGRFAVGFLDDDTNKRKQKILGIPVLGRLDELARIVPIYGIHEVLIAIPSASGAVVRKVVEQARTANVESRIIPGIYDMLSGRIAISQLREVDVEDLLKREPVRLDMSEIAKYVEGKIVLVTGAGGSIGSELVRQISRFNPKTILLLGRGENSIYSIERDVMAMTPKRHHIPLICDVRDRERLEYVFRTYKPQVIFHAAAHKHVPLMECNADEAIFNNVGGTRNLVELALKYDVERFVNISTDKAVNPTSVMGASKRVAEFLVEWAATKCKPGQSYVSVRFGNVLGSRGSVIPLFRDQIRKGLPVTVTHADMTRYFMTIPEAVQLVIQAGGLGDNGAVYVLDMGQPVKIIDLARDLIQLSGLTPGVDIEIEITGMRPGEKLYEELMTAEEGANATRHEKIAMARKTGYSEGVLEQKLSELFEVAKTRDSVRIIDKLCEIIPTFQKESPPRLQAVQST